MTQIEDAYKKGYLDGSFEYRAKIENRIKELEELEQKIKTNNKIYGFTEAYESPKHKQIRISIEELRNLL